MLDLYELSYYSVIHLDKQKFCRVYITQHINMYNVYYHNPKVKYILCIL